jgi:phenylpyruvate tautomerase PptA (4-oxalocrotonate tautomerase family)
MPIVRVAYPTGALTADQKEKLAPLLAESVLCEELDPVTENGRSATPVFFHEIDERNCFMGGKSLVSHPERTFWIVEAIVAASFFNQVRRDALQAAIGKAFVAVLGDDGSAVEREGLRISPAYLLRVYSLIVEIPEGSWGVGGQTVDTDKITKIIGRSQSKQRMTELKENTARLKAARSS